ncbi:MAG: hypothetical protein O2954_09130 [bacterium]|nr:hypothetical protein [bacterium]
MTCDMKEERLIGLMYGELDPAEQETVAAHVAGCVLCTQAMAQMSQTGRMLRAWPDEEPGMDLVFVQDRAPFWNALVPDWFSGWGRFAAGVAMGTAVVLLALMFLNFEAEYQDGSLRLSVGKRSAQEAVMDPMERPITLREFAELQEQSIRVIQELIQNSEERQQETVGFALSQFARDLEAQRQRDLQLVGQGLEGVEYSTQRQLRQLGQLITLTSQGGQ